MGLYEIQSVVYRESTCQMNRLLFSNYVEIDAGGSVKAYTRREGTDSEENLREGSADRKQVHALFETIRDVLNSDTKETLTFDDMVRELSITYSATHTEKLLASVGEGKDWLPSIILGFAEKALNNTDAF